MASFVLGLIMGLLSLAGLLLASRAGDGTMYVVGLLLFLFGLAVIVGLVHRSTGHPRPSGHQY